MEERHFARPRTVDEIFEQHFNRRRGMLRALITEFEEFYRRCDPDSDNLSLYSFPDGSWEVSKPAEEIPSELPEPCLGINFSRDGLSRKNWVSLVSAHSDSWLFAVAFFYASTLHKKHREKLFDKMNELPTLYEVVQGQGFVNQMRTPQVGAPRQKVDEVVAEDTVEEEDEDEEGEDGEEDTEAFCGTCEGSYSSSKSRFWILCDTCKRWYHGKCVKMTAALANRIENYECPSCAAEA